MTDVLERLKKCVDRRVGTGDSDVNTLITPISVPWGTIDDAIAEIIRLRAQVFGQGARLDQLHTIVGAAMAEPLTTFADIKKEIRNG